MKPGTLTLFFCCIPALLVGWVAFTATPEPEDRNPGLTDEDQPEWELVRRNSRGPVVPHPQDPEVLFHPTGGGLWKSTDGGDSWQRHDEEGCCGGVQSMVIHPEHPDTMLIAGGVSGVLLSTDAGESWLRANGGIHSGHHGYNVTDVVYHQSQGAYYAGNTGGGYEGLYRSKGEQPWEWFAQYMSVRDILVDEETGAIFAAAGTFMKSSDGGESWQSIVPEEGADHGLESPVRELARVPGSRTLYAGTSRGIYKSYDEGEKWFSVSDSLTETQSFGAGIAVPEADTNLVFAAATHTRHSDYPDSLFKGGIFISQHGGEHWQKYHANLPDTTIYTFVETLNMNKQTNTLFAVIRQITEGPEPTHLFRMSNMQSFTSTENGESNNDLPQQIRLYQNYPNPFNATTTIEYELPEEKEVELHIYDVAGRHITTLVDGRREAGLHEISWDASEMASGTYIYRLEVGGSIESHTMTLIK